jgi:hypothetical protein
MVRLNYDHTEEEPKQTFLVPDPQQDTGHIQNAFTRRNVAIVK